MRLHIIRALRSTFAHFVNLMDNFLSLFFVIIGRTNPDYLKQWEGSLGQRVPPKFPPEQIPSTPRYGYSRMDFNSRVRAAVIVTWADIDLVKKELPDVARLEPVPGAPPGKHPVMLSFGVNERFGAVITPWRLRTITYKEFLCSVPNVHFKEGRTGYCGPFLYPPRIWASHLLPVIVGKILAFPKDFACIDGRPDSFTIRRFLESRPIASLKVRPMGEPVPAQRMQAALSWCGRVNQPIMTETGDREPLFCHFQFEWNLAVAQPAEVSLTVHDARFPFLAPGVYSFDPIRDPGGGAMLIASPAHLQLPFPRSSLNRMNPGPCAGSGPVQSAAADRQLDTERSPN